MSQRTFRRWRNRREMLVKVLDGEALVALAIERLHLLGAVGRNLLARRLAEPLVQSTASPCLSWVELRDHARDPREQAMTIPLSALRLMQVRTTEAMTCQFSAMR